MNIKILLKTLVTTLFIASSAAVKAEVSENEATKLGNELTCMEAVAAGNDTMISEHGFGYTGYKGAMPFPIQNQNQALHLLSNHNSPYR